MSTVSLLMSRPLEGALSPVEYRRGTKILDVPLIKVVVAVAVAVIVVATLPVMPRRRHGGGSGGASSVVDDSKSGNI